MNDEQRIRIYARIQKRLQREYFAWGFVAGFLAGAGVTLLAYPRMP